MSKVLTVRIQPDLLAKAEARALELGLDRAGYVRSLIEEDLTHGPKGSRRKFASEDLVGAYDGSGLAATNQRVRDQLRKRR